MFLFFFLQQEDDEMLVPHNEFVEGPQPMEGEIFNSILFLSFLFPVSFYVAEVFFLFLFA